MEDIEVIPGEIVKFYNVISDLSNNFLHPVPIITSQQSKSEHN